jgi:hypothetical protein
MNKTSFSLTAAAFFAVAAPQIASAAEGASFAHKGVNYAYTTEETGGEKVIRGTAYAGAVPFELHVHKKSVTGTFNNQPVEFTLKDVQKLGIVTDAK